MHRTAASLSLLAVLGSTASASETVRILVGIDGPPVVRGFDPALPFGLVLSLGSAVAPPTFTGGVRVAAGDLNGDGVSDFVASTGPGSPAIVAASNGVTQNLIAGFRPFGPTFTGGVHVAVGDVDADGRREIIVGGGAGAPSQVTVFRSEQPVLFGAPPEIVKSFDAYPGFGGGVFVAAGDLNGDGRAEIVTGPGAGGGSHVKAFNGTTGAELLGFNAYPTSFSGGVRVAVGDVNGDGRAEIITGASSSAGPHVRVFSGSSGAELASFFAFSGSFSGGVNVATGNWNDDAIADIFVTPDAGGGPAEVLVVNVSGSAAIVIDRVQMLPAGSGPSPFGHWVAGVAPVGAIPEPHTYVSLIAGLCALVATVRLRRPMRVGASA